MLCRQAAQASAGASPLALVAVTDTNTAQSSSEAALAEEVAGLKASLATVAPQLHELAGMKQQMGQLLTLLQASTAGRASCTVHVHVMHGSHALAHGPAGGIDTYTHSCIHT